jgi:hypothetical protein
MEKIYRLINLLLIFIPLALLAIMAGSLGLIFFELRYWKTIFLKE